MSLRALLTALRLPLCGFLFVTVISVSFEIGGL